MTSALCQRAGASCGACCGLYNREDLSRAAVREDLARSTDLFARTPRTPEAFGAAAEERATELPEPLFPSVRICPLLGYLDGSGSRIGCLGHPRVTGGPDLRSCGVYDELTCGGFLCPSHAYLGEDEATLAARACDDFYLYGLVVTDAGFLRAVLEGLEALVGRRPGPADLDHAPFRRAIASLLGLKEELAPGSEGLFAAFRPAREKQAAPVEERADGTPAERVLAALGGDLRSGNDTDALEGEVGRRLAAAAEALAGAVRGRDGGAQATGR